MNKVFSFLLLGVAVSLNGLGCSGGGSDGSATDQIQFKVLNSDGTISKNIMDAKSIPADATESEISDAIHARAAMDNGGPGAEKHPWQDDNNLVDTGGDTVSKDVGGDGIYRMDNGGENVAAHPWQDDNQLVDNGGDPIIRDHGGDEIFRGSKPKKNPCAYTDVGDFTISECNSPTDPKLNQEKCGGTKSCCVKMVCPDDLPASPSQ